MKFIITSLVINNITCISYFIIPNVPLWVPRSPKLEDPQTLLTHVSYQQDVSASFPTRIGTIISGVSQMCLGSSPALTFPQVGSPPNGTGVINCLTCISSPPFTAHLSRAQRHCVCKCESLKLAHRMVFTHIPSPDYLFIHWFVQQGGLPHLFCTRHCITDTSVSKIWVLSNRTLFHVEIEFPYWENWVV